MDIQEERRKTREAREELELTKTQTELSVYIPMECLLNPADYDTGIYRKKDRSRQ